MANARKSEIRHQKITQYTVSRKMLKIWANDKNPQTGEKISWRKFELMEWPKDFQKQ